MPGKRPLTASVALAATVAAVAGCGSKDVPKTIPPDTATTLKAEAAAVQQAAANGDCATAEADARTFLDEVNGLPSTVGASVKAPLQAAGKRLEELASDPAQCQPSGATGLSGAHSTKTTTSVPAPTTTASVTSTTSTTTTTTTKPPPSQGNGGNSQGGNSGSGGGNPSGGGGSGGGTGGTGTGGVGGKR